MNEIELLTLDKRFPILYQSRMPYNMPLKRFSLASVFLIK